MNDFIPMGDFYPRLGKSNIPGNWDLDGEDTQQAAQEGNDSKS